MASQPSSDELIAWVGRYILPHETRLRAWLRSAFTAIEIDDVIQEAYCRIASLSRVDHIADPRQYLFRTAKNVVLEQIRRSRVVTIETATGIAELYAAIPEDFISPERVLSARYALDRVEKLIAALPERACRIFRLRKIEGLSQRQVASELGISEMIVENELSRSLQRILQSMTEEERAELPIRRRRYAKQEWRVSNDDR